MRSPSRFLIGLALLLLPTSLALAAPFAYIPNAYSNNVSVIDTPTNTIVATVPVGAYPVGVTVNAAGTRVYVNNVDASSVSVIDTTTKTVVATVPVGAGPAGIAADPVSGRVYVANIDANSVSVIDTAINMVVATVPVGAGPGGIAVNPAGTRVYVTNPDANSVGVIDAVALAVIATVRVGAYPTGIAVTPAGTRVYVANADANSVSVIDSATNTVVATVRVGGSPFAFGQFIGPASTPPASAVNYGGMWWNAPADSESGWGINFAHQGDTIFATWFTFGFDGKPWWLVVAANKIAPNVYSGDIYTGTGPPFNALPFDPAQVVKNEVGTATFTFADTRHATFAYTVSGIAQTKRITLEEFGSPVPTCTWSMQANLAAATNYQDMWWAAPAGSESGWGINFAQQGDTIFATWFTFGFDGKPLWLVLGAPKVGPNVYAGDVYTGTGPPFNALPWNPAQVVKNKAGTATLTFSDGNHATFAYAVNGVSQTKPLTREIFGPPGSGTVCR